MQGRPAIEAHCMQFIMPRAFLMSFVNARFAVTGVFDSDYAVLNPDLAWVI